MDLINELAFILSNKKPNEFDNYLHEKSKVRLLYDLITQKKVTTDDEASRIIYNSDKSDKKYLMLKRNLIQKLSELVFILDYSEDYEENYANIQFSVEKELNIAEKLILENVYHNPSKTIVKVEQTAEKYYLIDVQLAAAKKLRSVYSLKGFPNETEQYDDKVKKLTKYQQYYNESKGMWEILYSKTKYTIAKIPEMVFQAYHYSEIIRKWLLEYDSPFLRLFYYRINIIKFDQQNEHIKVFENIESIDKLLKNFNFLYSKNLLIDLNYEYALYYRNTRQLEKAESYINKCLEYADYRAFNKFLIKELQFDIFIKQERYTEAGKNLWEVFHIPQYEFLDPNDKSAWAIREAYLYFIFKTLKLEEELKHLPNVDIELDFDDFILRTKKSTKDKYGYNILFLIIRLQFLAKNNIREIDNEGNNMLIYFHRYLKSLNSKRTLEFFKSVSKIASRGFETEYMTERFSKMKSRFEDSNTSIYDVFEIIPYERFWEMITKYIKSTDL